MKVEVMQGSAAHQTPSSDNVGPHRVNIRRLAFVLVGLSVAVPLATAGVILGAQPNADPVSALAAIVPSVIGAIVGLTMLTGIRAQAASPGTFTLICLVGGASRLLSSIALALAVYLLADPEKIPFWISFLVTGLSMLIAETVILLSSTSQHTGAGSHAHTHTGSSASDHDAAHAFQPPDTHTQQRADEQAA